MGKHTYLNGKSETPHAWTCHSRRPESRGCGRLSARWRLATRPHGAARLRRRRGRNDAASRTLDVADGFRLPFSGFRSHARSWPLWFRGASAGAQLDLGPGLTRGLCQRSCTGSTTATPRPEPPYIKASRASQAAPLHAIDLLISLQPSLDWSDRKTPK